MNCTECIHYGKDKCDLKACIYTHITQKEWINAPVTGRDKRLINGVEYKVIDFEAATNCFICVKQG